MAKALSPHPPEMNDGTITSWLPMATPWQAPDDCESSMWEFYSDALVAWDPGYGISVQTDLSCQPPEVTSWWDAERLGVDAKATQYSIGPVVCPEAYTTVTSSANDGGSTLVGCCPSNYSFKSMKSVGLLDQCQSHLAAGQVVKFATRISSTWVTTTSTVASASAAYAVQINGWLLPKITGAETETPSTHKPDHPSPPSRSPSSKTEAAPTELPTDQMNALPTTTSALHASSGSTSSAPTIRSSGKTSDQSTTDTGMGTRVGLGVGIPVGVILIASILIALWLRRRRQYPTKIAIASGPIELNGDDRYWAHARPHSKEIESPAELATPVDAVELPAFKECNPRRWDSQRRGPR